MSSEEKGKVAQDTVDDGAEGQEAVEAREVEIEEEKSVEEQLVDAEKANLDLQDQFLRVAAEFENYKKRMERERSTMLKYAGENIFRELLSVVDNLERATDQATVTNGESESSLAALLEGVQLTLKSLLSTLEKFEVKPIETVGQPFDPNTQEAMVMEPSDAVPANHVLNEFEKGYFYKDRLLRAARVVVSSGVGEGEKK